MDGVVQALHEDPHMLDAADTGFLVNTSKQLVLVDAGAGIWYGGGVLGRLAGNLRSAGYTPVGSEARSCGTPTMSCTTPMLLKVTTWLERSAYCLRWAQSIARASVHQCRSTQWPHALYWRHIRTHISENNPDRSIYGACCLFSGDQPLI